MKHRQCPGILRMQVIYAALPEAYDVLLNRRCIGASRQNQ